MLPADDEKAPGFKNWSSWYGLVISMLVVVIILFYLFTKHYA
jgi:hypothetical protein